jgi:hypothetical protein
MSVAGIQATNILPFNAQQLFIHQRSQDIRQLDQALHHDDLAGAQQAYASLLALAQQSSGTSSSDSNAAAALFRNPKVANDFAALGQALQAGDLAGAQQAFAAFRQDARNGRAQSRQQPAPNTANPEIVINLSGILPSNTGASQPAAPSSSNTSGNAAGDASGSSSGSTTATTGQTGSQTGSLPEIVLNLFGGNGSFAGPEIIFNFGSNNAAPPPAPSSSDQQSTNNSQSPQSPEIVFNLANSGVSEIDLNLGGSNPGLVLKFAQQPSSSANLNVVA